jgi:hypothetical protein
VAGGMIWSGWSDFAVGVSILGDWAVLLNGFGAKVAFTGAFLTVRFFVDDFLRAISLESRPLVQTV